MKNLKILLCKISKNHQKVTKISMKIINVINQEIYVYWTQQFYLVKNLFKAQSNHKKIPKKVYRQVKIIRVKVAILNLEVLKKKQIKITIHSI